MLGVIMSKIPYQRLLKWSENHHDETYDYVICRGALGSGYLIEGYFQDKSGKNDVPRFRLPYPQEDVALEFSKQGKQWNFEVTV